ncbi:hypothetical protein [Caldimonas brevitalea]|uniref:hypothetical protein n=1 Tax=Caldimonas brevitalea TaxID=413882 RepID=UPI0012FCEF97|nr:hypothetical protein [Caldimonas brevitalea]
MKPRHAIASLLAFVLANMCSAVHAQSNQPEKLPAAAGRQVIGTWKLQDGTCTRSIEQIVDRFFIVARCRHPADIDGSIGIPLSRLSERAFRNRSGVRYEIQEDGTLHVIANDIVYDRGTPQKDLWPQ